MTFVLAAGKRCAVLSVLLLWAFLSASAQTPELQTYSAEFTVPFTQLGAYPTPTIDQLMAWSPRFYDDLSTIKQRAPRSP